MIPDPYVCTGKGRRRVPRECPSDRLPITFSTTLQDQSPTGTSRDYPLGESLTSTPFRGTSSIIDLIPP